MSQFRLAVLLSLLAGAGCYLDAPPQSTLPEPQYVSGPPGGAIDPDFGYPGYPPGAGDPSAGDPGAGDPGAGSVALVDPGGPDGTARAGELGGSAQLDLHEPNAVPALDEAGAQGPPEPVEADEEAGAAAAPDAAAAGITDEEIYATLDGYGQWIETDAYGDIWRPDATVVGVDFTPYASGGSWVYTDAGWAFSCDYSWGWLPFHYGRWTWFDDYWAWVPGYTWGPAWVEWRHGGGVIGWRPLRPRIRDHRRDGHLRDGTVIRDHRRDSHLRDGTVIRDHRRDGHLRGGTAIRDHRRDGHLRGGTVIRDHRRSEPHDAHWRFATVADFARPRVRSHLYGNLAEGLRVTSRVAAPPIRARAFTRASDLMRNRFAAGARWAQPGSGRFLGPAQVRDHRRAGPVGAYPQPRPAQTVQPAQSFRRPVRPQSYQPPVRTFPAPARTVQPSQSFRPPLRSQVDQRPVRSYQAPVRSYQAPVRSYQAPVRSYQAPVRSHQAPVRSYQAPVRSSPPARSSSPSSSSASSRSSVGSRPGGGGSHSGGGSRRR